MTFWAKENGAESSREHWGSGKVGGGVPSCAPPCQYPAPLFWLQRFRSFSNRTSSRWDLGNNAHSLSSALVCDLPTLWALTVTANCKSANLRFPTEKSYLKLLILMYFRVKSMKCICSTFVDQSTLLNSSSFALYVTISCHGWLSRIWQKCFLLLQLTYW